MIKRYSPRIPSDELLRILPSQALHLSCENKREACKTVRRTLRNFLGSWGFRTSSTRCRCRSPAVSNQFTGMASWEERQKTHSNFFSSFFSGSSILAVLGSAGFLTDVDFLGAAGDLFAVDFGLGFSRGSSSSSKLYSSSLSTSSGYRDSEWKVTQNTDDLRQSRRRSSFSPSWCSSCLDHQIPCQLFLLDFVSSVAVCNTLPQTRSR